jgi:CrcB protein
MGEGLSSFQALLLVGVGGGLGSSLRYFLGGLVTARVGPGFPLGILLINFLGSCLIVLFHTLGAKNLISQDVRLFLTTGVLGGFTTYSTFNYDTLLALDRGQTRQAVLNLVLTVPGCLVGAALTLWAVRGLLK